MAPPVRIAALGGLGEIGMNCLVVECDDRIAVVDCGLLFPDAGIGADVVVPDLSWLRERADRVDAVFVTHGHEDHVGALPVLLRDVRAPVYGAPFALALLRRRLGEAGVEADLRVTAPGAVRRAGPMEGELFAVTHSIPDACGLALRTPQGIVLHSGDFKVDDRPAAGPPMDLAGVEAFARAGVRLLLSDSTNADRPGRALSESAVRPGLESAFDRTRGRVLVACFATHVHRIQQVADVARARGRRVAFLGRAMEEVAQAAMGLGLLAFAPWQLSSLADVRDAPPAEGCVLVSGTQGEPRSALSRLARGEHPDLSVGAGDRVVFSARVIPGSERAVGAVLDGLARQGAEVSIDGDPPLHASGHGQEEDQRLLLRTARPEAFVPIHGEWRHLVRHAAHAAAEGVAVRHVVEDGAVVELTDAGVRVAPERLPVGRVYADREDLGQGIAEVVIRDRRLLAESGVVTAVLVVDRGTGAVVRGPDLFAVGVAGFDGNAEPIRAEATAALAELSPGARASAAEVQEALRAAVRRWFRREGLRRPSVLPVVLEL